MRIKQLLHASLIALTMSFAIVMGSLATTYTIVDTGLQQCFNNTTTISTPSPGQAFYGQDGCYEGNQPSYVVSGDGLTVYDANTGLTWQQSADTNFDDTLDSDDKLTWVEFQSHAATLNSQNFGGYNDWRAPSIKELYSIIDFRGLDPSGPNPTTLIPYIDTDYFEFAYGDESAGERLIDAQYWSTTQYTGLVMGNQNAVFGFNFADGRIKGYPRDTGPGGTMTQFARFVRGNTDYGINQFVDNDDGTITDTATGLMWMKSDNGEGVIWENALSFSEISNHAGYDDWRLPNTKELQSILDYTRGPDATGSGAIDPMFEITQITNEATAIDYPWFWTGTTHANSNGGAETAAYVCFGRSTGYFGPPGMESWVDVHGAGAQRSDRKDGNFSGYSYAYDGYYHPLAPQGDAVRMYNFVRCVRDAPIAADANDDTSDQSNNFELNAIPNPMRGSTTLRFNLQSMEAATLEILDASGRICRAYDVESTGEMQTVAWNGTDARGKGVAAGVYFARLYTDSTAEKERIKLLVIR
jgi:Protein of unknown function (DUF1566)/FlgD Ig-like domain